MHEGRMIFTGSTRDMKQRLRRDDFSLEVEGDEDKIRRLARDIANLEGIDVRLGAGQELLVQIAEDHSRPGALAEVLKLVDASGLALQGIHSGRNATENAYLQLLQEDEAHGFGR
jgi:hypothetical protein